MKQKFDKAWFLKNRANFVTWLRMGICIFLLWPINCHPEWLATVTLPLMAIAGGTDKLDGWLAKKYGIASEFGGKLDRASDKWFALDAFNFFLLDWRVHIMSKVFAILMAGVEGALIYHLVADWIAGRDASTIKRPKSYGYGQIKMSLLCAAIYLQQLSIIFFGLRYHDVVNVLVGLMLFAGIFYAVLSWRGYAIRRRARLLPLAEVPAK